MNAPDLGGMLRRAGRAVASALDFSRLDPAAIRAERDRIVARAGQCKPPITRVLPVARAIPLGGELRVAGEFRLDDLARLQGWLEERSPHPLEGMPPAWADPEPETRMARLAAAWEAAASWPPRLFGDEGSRLLAEPGGQAYFLAIALGRFDPSFGLADAMALLSRVTPAEWSGLIRVVYAISPREEIAAELAPDRSPRSPANWCKVLDTAMELRGLGYAQLGELTVSQWHNLLSGGQSPELTPAFANRCRAVRRILEAAANG